MLPLPVLALAAAWSHAFPLSGGQCGEQQHAALMHTTMSRRLAVLVVLLSLLSNGQAQVLLQQRQPSLTKRTSSTAVIDCKVEGIDDFQGAYIHWYRHIPSRAPERLLYVTSTAQISYDKDSYKDKYHSSKRGKNTCTLSVKDIREDDEGTYYCAYWHSVGNLVFGTGTKFIVSNKGNSKPENSEILQTKHKDQLLYVCLIENFYPEVIRVQWVDEANKEVTKNVIKGDVWKSTNDKYSVSTWLTLPGNTTNKNYYCKYDHESQENFKLSIQDSSETPSQEEYCSTYSGNSTVFYKDYLMHKAAHLVYLVLLLKSSMYYVIVLFFIYRMRTPAKLPGKKT
ncbi:T-cell receptor gamma alternate reading frame protein isoform X1 [Anas acuta]|uniref:T-cell receptor gamma alternate reading frame protein isoform X1 n=1 Tax=Anas acuta TaxID=28680 RepID=UPI0035C8FCEC